MTVVPKAAEAFPGEQEKRRVCYFVRSGDPSEGLGRVHVTRPEVH